MSNITQLQADDGHLFNAYISEPAESSVGGVVILPEIFGITQHLRDVADDYAQRGFRAIVPALFDRAEANVNLSYEEVERGLDLMNRCTDENALLDIQAAIEFASVDNRVAVQGYCWGGSLAFLSACELNISAAVSFYGGDIINQLHRRPKSPVMFHFGAQDKSIPEEAITDILATFVNHSKHIAFVYNGVGHAFANTHRASFSKAAAALANQRSEQFVSQLFNISLA